jgi:hypothetical protein
MEWNSSIVKIKYEKLLFDLPVDIFIFISAAKFLLLIYIYSSVVLTHFWIWKAYLL